MQNETIYESGSSPNDDNDKPNKNTNRNATNITSNNQSSDFLNKSDNYLSPMPLNQQQKHHSNSLNLTPTNVASTSNTSLTSSATNSSRSNQLSTSQQNPSFDSNVISERVKNLATQIYQELKRIISRCNYNEDILSGLMPLIVRVLESLDLAIIENQQLQVELELCKDDNEQLVAMFEKEKQAKRVAEKKLIETEFAFEEDRQKYQQKIEALDNTVKLSELKAKNACDQASRFEEKDAERKAEYTKLHDRYTELLKTHCDVVERFRLGNSSLNVPDLTLSELSHASKRDRSEEVDLDKARTWNAETELTLEDTSLVILDESNNTSETDIDQDRDGDKDSIAYTSMEKEFRKLIQENKDLLNTKNALNVVKDDLIAEVDRLSNEVSMYEQALTQLNVAKEKMKNKISDLDSELKKSKNELEKAKQKIRENNEDGVPHSQRKRFGRAEMAKVLMERNDYKERYLELQNSIKYSDYVRANKQVENEKSKSSIWKFFNNLFGTPTKELLAIGGPGMQTSRTMSASQIFSYGSSADQQALCVDSGNRSLSPDSNPNQGVVVLGGPIRSTNQRLSSNSDFIFLLDSDLNIDRNRAYKQVNKNFDMSSYVHAYGWSLSNSSIKLDTRDLSQSLDTSSDLSINNILSRSSSALKVPIPQYIRPLTSQAPGMKIWCGTAIEMSGGEGVSYDNPLSTKSIVQLTQTTGSNASKSIGDRAIQELEDDVNQALNNRIQGEEKAKLEQQGSKDTSISPSSPIIANQTVAKGFPTSEDIEESSSCVWICSTQHSKSQITIIDIKTKPDELLDHFFIPTFIYCIKALPGAKPSDLSGIPNLLKAINEEAEKPTSRTLEMMKQLVALQKDNYYTMVKVDPENEKILLHKKLMNRQQSSLDSTKRNSIDSSYKPHSGDISQENCEASSTRNDAEISRILDKDTSIGVATLQKLNEFIANKEESDESMPPKVDKNDQNSQKLEETDDVKNDVDTKNLEESTYQSISSFFPTVWMGGRNCILYLHSAIGQWKEPMAHVRVADSILQICHFRGRTFVALADGSICIFMRNIKTKEWEMSCYMSLNIALLSEKSIESTSGSNIDEISARIFKKLDSNTENEKIHDDLISPEEPKNTKSRDKVAGIRCMEIANKNLWIGYRNRIIILDPISFKPKHIFNVVPQADNQIRQIASMKDGVFICLRSDLILRLYSSLKPYNHIQNIDIEPVVTRFVSPRSFVISHITAMKVVNNTLWIGNDHGIILTIPFTMVPMVSESNDSCSLRATSSSLSIASSIPNCDISNAQISFHGHADAVRFFINSHDLMLSGGLGYLDFRLDSEDQLKSISNDKSHLILWQLFN